jgi:hypothetical protein
MVNVAGVLHFLWAIVVRSIVDDASVSQTNVIVVSMDDCGFGRVFSAQSDNFFCVLTIRPIGCVRTDAGGAAPVH